MGAFGVLLFDKEHQTADCLDQSAFDEKFEIDLENDYIRNIYHIENKYHVPVLAGGYREMFSYCRDNLIYPGDKGYAELMDPDHLEELLRSSQTPGVVQAEFREMLVDGSFRWVQYLGISGEDHGVPAGKIYFYVYDIQNKMDRQEGHSSTMYMNDRRNQVTGLRTREQFLSAASELCKSEPGPWCCLAIDIQHFKIFNSWYGYAKGDYLLSRIGSYLQNLEKTEKVIAAYVDRDTIFAAVLRHDEERIRQIFEDLREIVFSYSNMVGFLPAFGICLLNEGEKPSMVVYDRARAAVDEAKKSYTRRIRYSDFEKYARALENYELLMEFQSALTSGEIHFCLQPQCRISTGKIVGAEALARWVKKDGTVISPGAFVPLLESCGFITELDKSIWDSVCRWLRSLIDRNITPIPISINVSQVDLLSIDIAAYLYALTQNFHIPTKLLKVEITESVYAEDFDRITQTIADLKKRGFSVFLDDFGSGYSSLNMLDKINVDLIKLDMVFMKKESGLSKKGISIVELIMGMTKALELPVIVEGVETDDQITFLRNLGCRYAQGYYFYRPVSPEEFDGLLSDPANVDYRGFQARTAELFHAKEFLNENMFTDSALNRILGPVAYYLLEGQDLAITRYNELFRRAIGDEKMDDRRIAIQNYVVAADRPVLYQTLREAENHAAEGGNCDIRFYKSDNSVFWFHMQFFYLKKDGEKKLFYGQVEDITEQYERNIRFLELLRKGADITMRMDLGRNTIQYATGESTLYQVDLPTVNMEDSIRLTAAHRIEGEADRQAFIEFFDPNRIKEAYRKAIYHEVLDIEFKLEGQPEPVEFSTYYFRFSKDQSLTVYTFVKRCGKELPGETQN